MAKKIQALVKLQIAAGKATPAPPVGTALGPQGVNIMDFCKNFNARTAKDEGLIIPVVVTGWVAVVPAEEPDVDPLLVPSPALIVEACCWSAAIAAASVVGSVVEI